MPAIILSDNGVSSGSAGLKTSGSNDGLLALQTTTAGGTATTAVTINTSQNVGVGVTPSAWGSIFRALQLGNGASIWGRTDSTAFTLSQNAYRDTSNNYTYIQTAAAGYYQIGSGIHSWYNAASGTANTTITFTQAMTLDASGNLGVGTTSPSSFDNSWNRLVVGTGSGDAGQTIYAGSASTASIAFADGTSGAQQYAGLIRYLHASDAMTFWTGAAERARIDSSGNLLVGTTSASGVARLTIAGGSIVASAPTSASSGTYSFSDNGSSPHTLRLYNSTDSNNTTNRFLICDAAASVLRAEIRSNGGIANFSGNNVNLSDRREKTNFAPAKSYLEAICAIPVQTFNYIDQNMEDDPGLTLGVVAQDVEAVAPELVMESNWGTEEDPKMRLSIYQTDLQYALMKCIQEQQAIIAQLQADVATLKGTP